MQWFDTDKLQRIECIVREVQESRFVTLVKDKKKRKRNICQLYLWACEFVTLRLLSCLQDLKSWHFHATSLLDRNQETMKKFRKLFAQGSRLNFLSLIRWFLIITLSFTSVSPFFIWNSLCGRFVWILFRVVLYRETNLNSKIIHCRLKSMGRMQCHFTSF